MNPPLVWFSQADGSDIAQTSGLRRLCVREMARLYVPHATNVLVHETLRVVVPRVSADALQLLMFRETGNLSAFRIAPVELTDAARIDTFHFWGLIPNEGKLAEILATRDGLLIAAENTRVRQPQLVCPENAWGRFPARTESVLRAYYRARVNDLLRGYAAPLLLGAQLLPEA